MIQLHTAAECRQADRKAIDDCCIPSASLMEEASCAAASILMNRLDRHERILFVAGCGNNGGDALATARIMYTHGYGNISLFLHEGRQSNDRALQLLICQRLGMRCVETMEGFDCIVDGLLGAGLSGAVRPAEQDIIHSINSASCPFVVSLDVPSGICDDFHCDEPVKADLTITFGSDKTSLHALGNRRFTKEIVTVPLSYPADAFSASSVSLASVQDYRRLELPADSYKVSRGRVAVLVDGSPYAVYVPYLFTDSFSTVDDYNNRPFYATFNRLLKYFSFVISVLLPGFYVAVGTYHQELLPASLMYTVAAAEASTPFSLMQEAVMVLILYEIMREAGLRLPKTIGHAVSIIGALVIGDAVVNAGLVGAPMLVVVAVTAIASYVIYPLYESISVLRIVFILLGGFTGIYGVMLGVCALCVNVTSLNPYGVPYSSPISPFSRQSVADTFYRAGWKKLIRRNVRVQNLRGADIDDD